MWAPQVVLLSSLLNSSITIKQIQVFLFFNGQLLQLAEAFELWFEDLTLSCVVFS